MNNDYKQGAVVHKMVVNVLKVKEKSTITSIIKKLKEGKHFEIIDYVYILDDNERLVGVISIRELFTYPSKTRVDKIMKRNLITINPETDQEKVAHIALKHGIKAVPVVEKGKLLGVVTPQKILHILNKSLQEDILHFAGIHRSHLQYENTIKVPLHQAIIHRVPWLIIGLIGIIFAAIFISIFESVLNKHLILAFFIPAIVYMSNALGTQNQTLLVRDLSLLGKELNIGYYFFRQMIISLFLGLIICSLAFLGILFFWKTPFIAFVISISMFVAIIITGLTSLIMTLIINKFGQDPALGSGPFSTIVSDITSIVIYFLMAVWLL